jgi:hypothetical protein
MAKWDIKDGFWRMDAEEGAKWNFAYVLPQSPGSPSYLMVPTSLQMGWVESPPFFCVASETARDVAKDYCETKMGTLPPHKFINYVLVTRPTSGSRNGMKPDRHSNTCLKFMSMIFLALLSQHLASSYATSVLAR